MTWGWWERTGKPLGTLYSGRQHADDDVTKPDGGAAVIDLGSIAQKATTLDPLPTSLTRLVGMIDDPDLLEVAEVVSFDQALTASLLRSANSSWSSSIRPITTVQEAVIRLGYATVFTMAVGMNVKGRMNRAIPEFGLVEGELWKHSVAASLAAELIPEYATVDLPPEVVTAGLLHDIGKLLVNRFAEPELRSALANALEGAYEDRLDVEIEVLGVHHGELGGLVVDAWKLPPTIATAIQFHHAPELSGEPIAYATALANIVAKIVGTGSDEGSVDVLAYAHAMEALGMDSDGLDAVVRTTYERFNEVVARYG